VRVASRSVRMRSAWSFAARAKPRRPVLAAAPGGAAHAEGVDLRDGAAEVDRSRCGRWCGCGSGCGLDIGCGCGCGRGYESGRRGCESGLWLGQWPCPWAACELVCARRPSDLTNYKTSSAFNRAARKIRRTATKKKAGGCGVRGLGLARPGDGDAGASRAQGIIGGASNVIPAPGQQRSKERVGGSWVPAPSVSRRKRDKNGM
jgi:hypothetical protein